MSRGKKTRFFVDCEQIDEKVKYLLFLFWPVGALIYSLKCPQSRSSRVIFFLICIAFGLCIECKDDSLDMSRITENFLQYRYTDFDTIKTLILDFINGVGVRDLYEFLLYWMVNQFSSNIHVFWMIASAIYAFFYVKSLSFILDDIRFKSCFMGLMIVLMFTMPQPIFTVTGLRFWTAGWLAILCTLQVFLNRNYKYCLVLLLTPFIHVMFWIYVALFIISWIFIATGKTCEKLLIVAFSLSFPFSYLSMSFLEAINISFLPSNLQMMLSTYTSKEMIEEFNTREGSGWFWLNEVFDIILNSYYLIMSYILIVHRHIISRQEYKNLFLFVLIIYSFANFTSVIPHLGLRFQGFAKILLPLLWFKILGLNRYKLFIYSYLLCASFYIFKIRLMIHYASVLDANFLYDSFVVMFIRQLYLH